MVKSNYPEMHLLDSRTIEEFVNDIWDNPSSEFVDKIAARFQEEFNKLKPKDSQ